MKTPFFVHIFHPDSTENEPLRKIIPQFHKADFVLQIVLPLPKIC